jgi:hypothetical protein
MSLISRISSVDAKPLQSNVDMSTNADKITPRKLCNDLQGVPPSEEAPVENQLGAPALET